MFTKQAVLFGLILMMLTTEVAHAQETTPTKAPTRVPTESEKPLDNTIKSLKEKIEDKVEQMNKSTKRIIKGVIASVADGTINLETDTDNEFTVSLDETITTFFQIADGEAEPIDQSDFEKGDYVIVSGPVIEDQVSANVVYKQIPYAALQGQVTAVNAGTTSLDIVTLEKDSYTLDIDDDTVQLLMNSRTYALEKATFSKYRVGDTLHFIVEKPEKTNTTISALRTLIVPQEFFVDDTKPTGDPGPTEEAE